MPSPRELRRRIKSVTGTAQITRAMQMVASSKMRKAQQAAIVSQPFARLLYRIQRTATTRLLGFSDPLLEVRPVKTRAVILVAADKGLCGPLNTNVFRVASQFDQASTLYITAATTQPETAGTRPPYGVFRIRLKKPGYRLFPKDSK